MFETVGVGDDAGDAVVVAVVGDAAREARSTQFHSNAVEQLMSYKTEGEAEAEADALQYKAEAEAEAEAEALQGRGRGQWLTLRQKKQCILHVVALTICALSGMATQKCHPMSADVRGIRREAKPVW